MKRILFIGEHLTLSHVMRPLVLAQRIQKDFPYLDIHFASGTIPARAQASHTLTLHSIYSPHPTTLQKRIEQALFPLYTRTEIRKMVEADQQLIQDIRPDLIIHDFRNTLPLSMHALSIPRIALLDFYWGLSYIPKPTVPDNPLTSLFGRKFSTPIARHITPKIDALHVSPFNAVLRELSIPPSSSLRALYNDAEKIWYMDAPSILPFSLRSHETCIGPILWDTEIANPLWLETLTDGEALCITFGTNGNIRTMRRVLEALKNEKQKIIVLTANRIDLPKTDNVYVATFTEFTNVLKKTSTLICHGGSSFAYPALVAGVPFVGIPSNLAQWYAMQRFDEKKLGVLLEPEHVNTTTLHEAIQKAETYKGNVVALQQELSLPNASTEFSKILHTQI